MGHVLPAIRCQTGWQDSWADGELHSLDVDDEPRPDAQMWQCQQAQGELNLELSLCSRNRCCKVQSPHSAVMIPAVKRGDLQAAGCLHLGAANLPLASC